ncbi:hypothetical protein D3C73_1269190 [compost metagenome]
MNFPDRQLTASYIRQPAVGNRRRCYGCLAYNRRHAYASKAGGQLQKDFCAIGMNPFSHHLAGLDEMVRVERWTRHRRQSAFLNFILDHRYACHNQASAAFRPFHIILHTALIEGSIRIAESARSYRGHDESVLQFQLADFERFK